MVSASTPSVNEPTRASHSKAPYKSTNLRKIGNYWYTVSDVVTASVYSEKTRLKKLIMIIIIIMNKSQETTVFAGA